MRTFSQLRKIVRKSLGFWHEFIQRVVRSRINSFSRTMGDSRKRHRCQNLVSVRRQCPLDLRPVDILPPSDHSTPAMSPIEGSSVPGAILNPSESIIERTLSSSKSNAVTRDITRQANKQYHKPLKADNVMNKAIPFHVEEDGSNFVRRPPSSSSSVDVPHAGMSETLRNAQPPVKANVEKRKTKKKEKPPPMTPADYARLLQAKAAVAETGTEDKGSNLTKRRKTPIVKFLEGKNIFYAGGDMKYASETTRGRMDIVGSSIISTDLYDIKEDPRF